MAAIDPYKVLGLGKTATQDEIKSAYRKLAKKYHPDLNPGNKEAETKFKDVNQANELIGTPEQRAKFDRGELNEGFGQGAPGGGPFGGFGGASRQNPFYYETQGGPQGGRYSQFYSDDFGGGSADEFFESLFGGGARARRAPERGEDTHYTLEVDFKDAVLGSEKEIQLPNGKRLRVKIPPGIETGKRLRFSGQGAPGPAGKPAGDAYVELVVKESSQFRRVGANIESEVEIPFPLAAVGGEWRVPTVDGAVLLKIPAHSSSGTKLRIRGKGVKSDKGDSRGDQLVILKLTTPSDLSPAVEEALRDWVQKHLDAQREAPGP